MPVITVEECPKALQIQRTEDKIAELERRQKEQSETYSRAIEASQKSIQLLDLKVDNNNKNLVDKLDSLKNWIMATGVTMFLAFVALTANIVRDVLIR